MKKFAADAFAQPRKVTSVMNILIYSTILLVTCGCTAHHFTATNEKSEYNLTWNSFQANPDLPSALQEAIKNDIGKVVIDIAAKNDCVELYFVMNSSRLIAGKEEFLVDGAVFCAAKTPERLLVSPEEPVIGIYLLGKTTQNYELEVLGDCILQRIDNVPKTIKIDNEKNKILIGEKFTHFTLSDIKNYFDSLE